MRPASPFHEGEQRVQRLLGVRDTIEPWARKVVRRQLPPEHRDFYAALPFLVVAARDENGRPWASLVGDGPGFAVSPDPGALEVGALPPAGDALADALREGDDIGLLGIELHSRRRNRLNGRVAERGDRGFALAVGQAFGNCPQYITERRWQRADVPGDPPPPRRGSALTAGDCAAVEAADTFFIASGYRETGDESETYGMDASHRGGAPGFVEVRSEGQLVFPDYAGNNHFNTLGNLLLDPRVGLLFVDFETGDTLQISGLAEIDWDSPEIARFPGARRLVRVSIEETVAVRGALPLRFEAAGEAVRELRVVEKKRESADVTSFLFEARDGSPLLGFSAGQYLPIELDIPGQAAPVVRTYSLSGAPDDPRYRISVKREARGTASRHLHDRIDVGDILSTRPARGEFVLHAADERPLVLVSAGVGITPLLSMLHAVVRDSSRPVWFVHGARDGEHHPLRREAERLAAGAAQARLHVAYSRPGPGDVAGRDHHSVGRVDARLIEELVPDLDADFYLCGPTAFMAALQEQLENRGVARERIHSESFGGGA